MVKNVWKIRYHDFVLPSSDVKLEASCNLSLERFMLMIVLSLTELRFRMLTASISMRCMTQQKGEDKDGLYECRGLYKIFDAGLRFRECRCHLVTPQCRTPSSWRVCVLVADTTRPC